MMDPRKVADVFDRMADFVDAVESEKRAGAESVQRARVDKVASAHASAHGEAIPDDIRAKLASTDPDVLAFLETTLSKSAGAPESLGGPAPLEDPDKPTVKEATDAAYERFGSWLIS